MILSKIIIPKIGMLAYIPSKNDFGILESSSNLGWKIGDKSYPYEDLVVLGKIAIEATEDGRNAWIKIIWACLESHGIKFKDLNVIGNGDFSNTHCYIPERDYIEKEEAEALGYTIVKE